MGIGGRRGVKSFAAALRSSQHADGDEDRRHDDDQDHDHQEDDHPRPHYGCRNRATFTGSEKG
jgi:hypothetical protein